MMRDDEGLLGIVRDGEDGEQWLLVRDDQGW